MGQINLLPWREKSRHAKKVRLLTLVGCAAGLAVICIICLHLYLVGVINDQVAVNSYIQQELITEQGILGVLKKKKAEKKALEDQIRFFVFLRQKTFQVVRLLDALPSAVPDGISLSKISRDKNVLTVIGTTSSNYQVTILMKNLSKIPNFNQPELTEIKTQGEKVFELKLEQQE